jgi:hypothetical protein
VKERNKAKVELFLCFCVVVVGRIFCVLTRQKHNRKRREKRERSKKGTSICQKRNNKAGIMYNIM